MGSTEKTDHNETTESKIKDAARRVFTEKGFAATRTRDIAEASGYNLALINYYFRSKERLFDIIMLEQLQLFLHSVSGIVNDRSTSLSEKIELLADHYIDMLMANPSLPFFIMNEINRSPEKFVTKLGVDKQTAPPYIVVQWNEFAGLAHAHRGIQLFINLIAMTVFPFIAAPILKNRTGMSAQDFGKIMEERKKLIPKWMSLLINESISKDGEIDNKTGSKKEKR